MESSNFTQLGLGSGRSGSSRRGKKKTFDKLKQPQRGLGVAQLEKIRLQNQMMGAYVSPFDCDLIEVGFGDTAAERDIRYSEIHCTATPSFLHHQVVRPSATLPLLEQSIEMEKHHDDLQWDDSMSSISQNFCNSQELDLELKL